MSASVSGIRSIALKIGVGTFTCPQCRTTQKFSHKQYKRYFSLYSVPILPINDGPSQIECDCCHTTNKPEILKLQASVSTYKRRHPLLITYGLIVIMVLAALISADMQVEHANAQEQQAAITMASTRVAYLTSFGTIPFELCNSASQTADWNVPANAHFLILNEASHAIASEYQDQLAVTTRAVSQQDLTHIVCLNPHVQQYDRVDNKADNGGKVYTCTRYVQVMDAYIIDVKTGKTVGYHEFQGSAPASCPAKLNDNVSFLGTDPTPTEITASLQANKSA